jgi:hypothetical protein
MRKDAERGGTWRGQRRMLVRMEVKDEEGKLKEECKNKEKD